MSCRRPTRSSVSGSGRWLAAVAGLFLTVGGAGARAADTAELRVGVRHLAATLDPSSIDSDSALMASALVFQGLVQIDDRGDVQPALSSQWSVSRDGLTWTFRIRSDAQFHNGVPLTPDDVVTSLSRQLSADDPVEPATPWARLFRGPNRLVREIRREEPDAVQLQLSHPFSPLLALLAHPALAIVSPASEGDARWLGTGPYRVSEQAPGRLVLDAVAGRSTRLVLQDVSDDAAGVAGLGPGGSLDVYVTQSPPGWAGLGLQVLSGPSWQVGLLALRSDRGVLRQKAARQGVATALDPALIAPALGRWAVPLGSYLPPGAWATRDTRPAPYDPARARRLFSQAGAGDPTLRLLASTALVGPDPARLAEAIRLSLASAGVKAQVRVEAGDAIVRAVRQGEGDLVVFETTLGVNDPHYFFQSLLAPEVATVDSPTNPSFFRSPIVDGLLSRASQLGFRPERLRLYQRLQTVLAEELPYVPLYVRLQWLLARPEVRGLRLDPGGLPRLDRVWVEAPGEPGAPPSSMPPRSFVPPVVPAPARWDPPPPLYPGR